jgi:hypothetical protein
MKKAGILLLVFLLGILVGVPIGARVGVWEFLLADAQYKASILAAELKSIKAGKAEPVVTGMEISLNAELAKHGEYMDSRLRWLWPRLRPNDDRPIRHAVAYRLANPYQGPDLTKSENWNPGVDMQSDFVRLVVEGQRTQEQYLRKVLERYGDKTPNNSLQPTPKSGAAERER